VSGGVPQLLAAAALAAAVAGGGRRAAGDGYLARFLVVEGGRREWREEIKVRIYVCVGAKGSSGSRW